MNTKNEKIGIEKLVRIIIEKWYICVICVAVCIIAVLAYYMFFTERTYLAYTTIYVTEDATVKAAGSNTNESTELVVNEKLAKDYKVIATSNRVLGKVKETLPNATLNAAKISVTAYPDTRILVLSVKDTNPYIAATIANEITTVMIEEVKDIISKNNIKVIDMASPPVKPQGMNFKVMLAITVLGGLFISILIILLYEIFDTKVKGPEDLKEHIDVPILGLIPQYDTSDAANNVKEDNAKDEQPQ